MSQIRSASTVLLIRKEPTSCHIDNQYLLYTIKRPDTMRFLPGYTAFPGGAVEEQDFSKDWINYVTSQEIRSFRMLPPQRNREDGNTNPNVRDLTLLVHGIAALRELFEETGILFCQSDEQAEGHSNYLMVTEHPKLQSERQALIEQKTSFLDCIKRLQVKLDTRCLLHFGTRLTPPSKPIRFDTQFFIAYVPYPIKLNPLPGEIAGDEWVSPTEALDKIHAQIIFCAPPTIECFSILAQELQMQEHEFVARIRA